MKGLQNGLLPVYGEKTSRGSSLQMDGGNSMLKIIFEQGLR